MKRRSMVVVLPMLACIGLSASAAEPSVAVRTEVKLLLDAIEASGCRFNRNGTWYTAHEARLHLRDKYDRLAARDAVHATEQFIDLAATQSSLSGRPYLIQCGDGPTLASNPWLREKLAQVRSIHE
jgi:hypothetical protein